MFVARVVLGKPFTVLQSRHNTRRVAEFGPDAADCDSVLAECRATGRATAGLDMYREFVVYDRGQCYPELLVTFERTDEEDPAFQ